MSSRNCSSASCSPGDCRSLGSVELTSSYARDSLRSSEQSSLSIASRAVARCRSQRALPSRKSST